VDELASGQQVGVASPPARVFGGGTVDRIPVRGLLRGGPVQVPDSVKKHGVHLVPVVIGAPGFSISYQQASEEADHVCEVLKQYFRVGCKNLGSEVGSEKDAEQRNLKIGIQSYDTSGVKSLYNMLNKVLSRLAGQLGSEALESSALLVLTRRTSPKIAVSPYYAVKALFSGDYQDSPASQVVTEKVLSSDQAHQMSLTNIALSIFTKLGGVPWRLEQSIPSADVVIGVGRTVIRRAGQPESLMGSVAILRSNGVFGEARATVVKSGDELATWINTNIQRVVQKLVMEKAGEIAVSIHYSGKRPSKAELKSVEETINSLSREGGARVSAKLVHITDDVPHRLMCSRYNMYPVGGLYWIPSDREAYIAPMGVSLGLKTGPRYPFTGIPGVLKVELVQVVGSLDRQQALLDSINEVYSLTFMHLAGLNTNIGEPVSTKYSRKLAYTARSLEIFSESTGLSSPAIERLRRSRPYEKLWFL